MMHFTDSVWSIRWLLAKKIESFIEAWNMEELEKEALSSVTERTTPWPMTDTAARCYSMATIRALKVQNSDLVRQVMMSGFGKFASTQS